MWTICSTYEDSKTIRPPFTVSQKSAALFPARQLWTEVKSERFISILSGLHAGPPPGSQPNTDTHHISWPVRLNRIPCCSKENTEFRCTEEGIRGRAVRKERGCYLVFTLQWQRAKWLFFPSRHCPSLKCDPGRWWRLVRKGLSAFRPVDQRAVSDMLLSNLTNLSLSA